MHHKAKLNITRLAAVILTLLLLSVQWMPAFAEESGKCGEALEWSYSLGTLTVTGEGEMTDFTEPDMAPWYHLRDQIRRVVLPDGLSSIGSLAFYQCENLTAVFLPASMRRIGSFAFAGCTSLAMLDLGLGVTAIEEGAFYGCTSLDALRLPYALTALGDQAFYRCESLTSIILHKDLAQMGHSVFAYCKKLVTAQIDAPLAVLPEWTFYGCDLLTEVSLPDTVGAVEEYAFRECGALTTIYFSGDRAQAEALSRDIGQDIPAFDSIGYLGAGTIGDASMTSHTRENEDGTLTQESVKVDSDEHMSVVTATSQTRPPESQEAGKISADLTVTVENKEGWANAADAVNESLKELNSYFGSNLSSENTTLTVYMKDGSSPDGKFVQDMAGRELELTFIAPDGSSWQFDCEELDQSKLDGNYDLSHTLSEATEEVAEKLGTDNGYLLNFEHSSEINTEVLIQLPSTDAQYSNAFLYQVEEDGSYTRLQAVQIDRNGVSHFYLASVDKDTQYVIGVDVPDETTDDVIIPDTLHSQYGDAIARLEKIEYVNTGVKSSWGLNFGQVTLILVGVLAVCIVSVGAVIGLMSKRKYQKQAGKSA